MKKTLKVNTGEVFKAFNKHMTPPKIKFHLCINQNTYMIINTKPHGFNCEITPEDCSLLSHKSHIDCGIVMSEPISNFKIIQKEQLSKNAVMRLIERIKIYPILPKIQSNMIVSELEKCL